MNNHPLILAFVRNLFFVFKIENAATGLGFRVLFIETANQIAPEDVDPPGKQFAEHLVGRDVVLLKKITQWQPGLIIFNLSNENIPWYDWIKLIASVPATRRVPILCYGSHSDVESMKTASRAGAIAVVARSRFVTNLHKLLRKYVKFADPSEFEEDCQMPLSPSAVYGLEEFNRGNYFAARESLLKAWKEDESKGRGLYRAVLQVAAAYHHILSGNFNGAAKMFLQLRQWIDPLPNFC
jgi:hypothetical protein